MKPELWKKIDELFDAGKAQPAEQRAAFLDRACPDDPELRGELESLLHRAGSADSFLEHSPVAAASDQPALKAGDRLGVFEIVERIGRGGMGEVYRAHDAKLGRDVAIKVLPPDFARDSERLRRFEHEARAASALNHPNILTVHETGSADGLSWIVTELVEGRSLRELLANGALAPRKAVEIAAQIADGLTAAHAAGIVHRDLKPENVMLAPGDLVKILDFGIAKWQARGAAAGDSTETLTGTGEVVGTVTSMSPEQVLGKEVDHRSDIFGLGTLLYEMLSGTRPFAGESRLAVMNAIVSQEPADLPATVPEAIAGIVQRCLEKLPERRFQSAADLSFALRREIGAHPHGLAAPGKRRKRWPAAAAAAVVGLGLAGGGLWLGRRTAAAPPEFHGTISRLTWDEGLTTNPAISPDGKLVAYASDRENESNLDIYVQQTEGGGTVRLTKGPADHDRPAFTPDGSRVAFEQEGENGGIYDVPALGGEERLLAPGGRKPRFSPDGRFLLYFAGGMEGRRLFRTGPETKLYVQPLAGGERADIARGCLLAIRTLPLWSPDSEHVLFTGQCSGQSSDDFWLADRDGRSLQPANLSKSWSKQAIEGVWAPTEWLANPSRLLISVIRGEGFQVAVAPFSADATTITGAAQFLAFGPGKPAFLSASADGRIVWSAVEYSSNLWRLAIDALGQAKGEPAKMMEAGAGGAVPRLSRDGRYLAFVSTHSNPDVSPRSNRLNSELRVMNLSSGAVVPLARRSGYLAFPVFLATSDRLLFYHEFAQNSTTEEVSIHGGTTREIFHEAEAEVLPGDSSADGNFFLAVRELAGRGGIVAVNCRNRKPIPILTDPEANLWQPGFSHDGRWVTFNLIKGDHSRIYIAPFRMEAVPSREWIPLTDGATSDDKPRLSSDDRLLFFLSDRDGFRCIWRQRLRPDRHPDGAPEPVFHFHSPQRSFLAMGLAFTELTVAPGVMIFNLGESRGNIWMLDPRREPRQ